VPVEPLGKDYLVRITSNSNPTINDTPNGQFWILGNGILVDYPNWPVVLQKGAQSSIAWYSYGNLSFERVDLYRNGTFFRTLISSVAPVTGYNTRRWLTPTDVPDDSNYTIAVTSTGNIVQSDQSDSPFSLRSTGLTLLSPNGGEGWRPGSPQLIRWSTFNDVGSTATLELLKGNALDSVISVRVGIYPNSFTWNIPPQQAAGNDYRIRIRGEQFSNLDDVSDQPFSIGAFDQLIVNPTTGNGTGRIF